MITEAKAQDAKYVFQGGIILLTGNQVFPVPGLQLFGGRKIGKLSAETGISVGATFYRQLSVLPVSGTVRWFPMQSQKLSAFMSLSGGYGLPWLNHPTEQKKYLGGGVYNPAIGLRIKTRKRARLYLMAGYNYQKASVTETQTDNLGSILSQTTEEYSFRRISLNLGLGF